MNEEIRKFIEAALLTRELVEEMALAFEFYDPVFGEVVVDGPNGRAPNVSEDTKMRIKAAIRHGLKKASDPKPEVLDVTKMAEQVAEELGGWSGFFEEALKRIALLAGETNKPQLRGSTSAAYVHGLLEARRVLRELAFIAKTEQLQALRGEKRSEGELHALHRSRGQREG